MQPDLERVIQYITDNRGTCKFTMGTKQESILYSPGAVINKKKTETVTVTLCLFENNNLL